MEFLRRRLGLIARALVSIALIAYLVRKIDWHQLWTIVHTMSIGWLIGSALCFVPVLLIVSWRWSILLRVHGVRLPFWRVFELNMIGLFFSSFLLGTTGGDVFKIFYAARAVPQSKAAVGLTVVVDRVIGMIALLLVGVALSCTQLHLLLSKPGTRLATATFYFFAIAGTVASVLATIAPHILKNDTLRTLARKLPFVHLGTPIFSAYGRTADAIGTNLVALLATIPSNVSFMGMAYCIIRAMDRSPALLPFCSIVLIVNMLIALPLSIAGIGFREGLFVMFFGLLLIDHDHAFAFSLTFFAVNLFWSLIGGGFYLLYRHETHTPAPDLGEAQAVFSQS